MDYVIGHTHLQRREMQPQSKYIEMRTVNCVYLFQMRDTWSTLQGRYCNDHYDVNI